MVVLCSSLFLIDAAPCLWPGLLPQVASYVQMPLEDRQAVVEGLARIVTFLSPQDVTDSALNIQQPHLTRTQAIITHGSSTAAQGGAAAKQLLLHLAEELQLMAVLIKGMEFSGQPPAGFVHPAMKLLEAAWPVLSAVADAPVCRQDKVVIEAVCEVHKVRIRGWCIGDQGAVGQHWRAPAHTCAYPFLSFCGLVSAVPCGQPTVVVPCVC